MSSLDLFINDSSTPLNTEIGEQATLFHQFLFQNDQMILNEIRNVVKLSPLRHLKTPSGHKMSVKSSNCGVYGWVSDENGYRYQKSDPVTGELWPQMPSIIKMKAVEVAELAGFKNFEPDACLINVYMPGAKMGLHQDRDEADFTQPIVSFSFGLPVTFMWGGFKRSDKYQKFSLQHADALVWGGEDRLRYHGVQQLKEATHPVTGRCRVNLTIRQAC
ncbi:DNA oxidative demethylase AlkB [Idiomarina sp. HP20-50]|uniref:DNA oxidative demethylase AlkB n=1 Tax=Idiomarina sp. HP20-50 TaxID=3070813 RepID=UPI00294AA43F|nr:DNA oxidative demethylase AlkB [Idiomarina sp. HP20-50]MDV6315154.1 DNA oxidative demethylase AlkB [Idiomarina sp. HP20-50]